ncbi:MAG TPA: septum formation initiator [Rhodopila sp.]
MRQFITACMALVVAFTTAAHAQHPDPAHDSDTARLPANVTTHQVLALPGLELRFTATAGSIRLKDAKDAPLTDIAFVAYQVEGADAATRPVTFVFNGGPGMASAWLQMGALGPWRVQLDQAADGPSAPPTPIPNAETWLDFTDLVFIDPPGTGYSRIVTPDGEARRRLWSVGGDISALAEAVRRWLDSNGRLMSPKYIVGESYGGFRGPRLVRKLQSDEGVGVSGLVLLSPLLDAHVMSGYADPLRWVDLLPSEVASVRARRGPVTRADLADVEAYAAGDYLADILRGGDAAAIDRLTERVAGLTGFDRALLRRLGGRLDRSIFQHEVTPGRVASVYDGTITRPNPEPREPDGPFPDPVLGGFEAPVSSAMVAVYSAKLNWHPDQVYHVSNSAAFSSWDWGRGIGRPESLSALQAARSVDPRIRVLVAQGLFDLVTPYFGTVLTLRLLPELPGAAPIEMRVYPGGHMFYFGDSARAALHEDAKAVFDPANATWGSR